MSGAPDTPPGPRAIPPDPASSGGDWGWYLYGVTRTHHAAADSVRGIALPHATEQLETISEGELEAVVRSVPLADLGPEALRVRADDPTWLEAMAERHNEVVYAIHQQRSILPARFGNVHPSAASVRHALAEAHDALLAQLDRIAGCDEWGLRLYGDLPAFRQRAGAEHPKVRQLRDELASAKSGRAYLLQRKLEEELAAVAEVAVDDLVERSLSHLRQHAVEVHVNRCVRGSLVGRAHGEIEVLRVAVLVPRAQTSEFLAHVQTLLESEPALRGEYSGPWPPYSFASTPGQVEEESP